MTERDAFSEQTYHAFWRESLVVEFPGLCGSLIDQGALMMHSFVGYLLIQVNLSSCSLDTGFLGFGKLLDMTVHGVLQARSQAPYD